MAGNIQGVCLDTLLDAPFDLRSGVEEAIGWHQAVNGLMRSLEVVVIDEVGDSTLCIGQIKERGCLQEFAPQCSPETFRFS